MAIFKRAGPRRDLALETSFADDGLIAAIVGYERRASASRFKIFDDNVINDSNWPLVQDLFEAHLSGAPLRTKELCSASGLPQTTVLRYLDHLEKFDVVRRVSDPADQRVTLVEITEAGALWVREYYSQVIEAEKDLLERGEGLFSLRPA
jgi:hypothetical protein